MAHELLDSYLFTEDDLRLNRFSHTFAACSIWHTKSMHKWVTTFDLTIREFIKRNFMLFSGLEEFLHYLVNFKFSDSDIDYLLEHKLITQDAAPFFQNLRFTGNVYSLLEGTPFFPGEPIVRVTAPICEAALVEVALMTIASSNIPFLTKAVRGVIASQGKFILSTGPVRSQAFESGMKACRAAYIAGMATLVTPFVAKKYKLDFSNPIINGQHFFIKSFPSEIEAMEALSETYPDNCAFMIDTYDMKIGIENAIKVAKKMEKNGHRLKAVMVDSGDLVYWCDFVRKKLDQAGLNYIQIMAGTNMDEYKIAKAAKKGIKCDILAIVTEFMTVSDSPKIEAVYKVAEIEKENEKIYTAKLIPGKMSLPGKKQIFRNYDKSGKMEKDIIGLDEENLGEPQLIKVIEKGEICYDVPSLNEIKEYTYNEIKKLPERILDLEKEHKYPVEISPKINDILDDLRKTHLKS